MDNKELKRAISKWYQEDSKSNNAGLHTREQEAKLLIQKALECGVPVREDKELLRQLLQENFLNTIPSVLFGVAAETLMYIYKIDSKFKGMKKGVANA